MIRDNVKLGLMQDRIHDFLQYMLQSRMRGNLVTKDIVKGVVLLRVHSKEAYQKIADFAVLPDYVKDVKIKSQETGTNMMGSSTYTCDFEVQMLWDFPQLDVPNFDFMQALKEI